jgi:hypothetical protein
MSINFGERRQEPAAGWTYLHPSGSDQIGAGTMPASLDERSALFRVKTLILSWRLLNKMFPGRMKCVASQPRYGLVNLFYGSLLYGFTRIVSRADEIVPIL